MLHAVSAYAPRCVKRLVSVRGSPPLKRKKTPPNLPLKGRGLEVSSEACPRFPSPRRGGVRGGDHSCQPRRRLLSAPPSSTSPHPYPLPLNGRGKEAKSLPVVPLPLNGRGREAKSLPVVPLPLNGRGKEANTSPEGEGKGSEVSPYFESFQSRSFILRTMPSTSSSAVHF